MAYFNLAGEQKWTTNSQEENENHSSPWIFKLAFDKSFLVVHALIWFATRQRDFLTVSWHLILEHTILKVTNCYQIMYSELKGAFYVQIELSIFPIFSISNSNTSWQFPFSISPLFCVILVVLSYDLCEYKWFCKSFNFWVSGPPKRLFRVGFFFEESSSCKRWSLEDALFVDKNLLFLRSSLYFCEKRVATGFKRGRQALIILRFVSARIRNDCLAK